MANNKYAGYTPKKEEILPNKGVPGSGTKLDRVNPYEFRKGMDIELFSVFLARFDKLLFRFFVISIALALCFSLLIKPLCSRLVIKR